MASPGTILSLTGDGNTDAYVWPGGTGLYSAFGTFGSGTAKLQYSEDETTWIDTGTDSEFTADAGIVFELPECSVRVNLNGSTTPTLSVVVSELRHNWE